MNKKLFEINYSATLKQNSNNLKNNIHFWVAEPVNDDYQKIVSFKFNKKPNKTYRYNDNIIHYFELPKTNQHKIEFSLKCALSKSDNKIVDKLMSGDNKDYLKIENYLKLTKNSENILYALCNEPKNPECLKKVFEYISSNFTYEYPIKNRGAENLDINNLKGDCGEYSSLFVAYLRSNGITSRNQTGFILFPKEESITEHGWAQALTKNGWADFDMQYASLEKNIEVGVNKYFGKRSEYRVSFTNGFNIPIKPKVKANNKNIYFEKIGNINDLTSIQVLQPSFYLSESPIEFSEKVSFKEK